MQEIAWIHDKNSVSAGEKREYGNATLTVVRHAGEATHMDQLLDGLGDRLEIYMSHGDKLASLPKSFKTTATTVNAPFAGIVHRESQSMVYSGILKSLTALKGMNCSRISLSTSARLVSIGQWRSSQAMKSVGSEQW